MPRYFLDLHEGGTIVADEEGVEHASLAAAHRDALRAARGIMGAEVALGRLRLACHIAVKDAAGTVVLSVPFGSALTVTRA